MEDVTSNKRKMKELEDNLLYRLTSTQVSFVLISFCAVLNRKCFYLVIGLPLIIFYFFLRNELLLKRLKLRWLPIGF